MSLTKTLIKKEAKKFTVLILKLHSSRCSYFQLRFQSNVTIFSFFFFFLSSLSPPCFPFSFIFFLSFQIDWLRTSLWFRTWFYLIRSSGPLIRNFTSFFYKKNKIKIKRNQSEGVESSERQIRGPASSQESAYPPLWTPCLLYFFCRSQLWFVLMSEHVSFYFPSSAIFGN